MLASRLPATRLCAAPVSIFVTAQPQRSMAKGKKGGKDKKGKSGSGGGAGLASLHKDETGASVVFDLESKFKGAVEALQRELAGFRAGTANQGMLDSVQVSVDGASLPVNALGKVIVKGPQQIVVQLFDGKHAADVSKAIEQCGLNFNPQVDGSAVKVPVPIMTKDTRAKMVTAASAATEDKKVRMRGMRKIAVTKIGKEELTKDEEKRLKEIVDGQLSEYEGQLKTVLKAKESELMQA